ncbi:hypothetical protein [Pontiella sulfatireligans]|uniref:Uncharacterized protein n=1 Tax=Pontiella sulfatireligans TaxID=2750658 RepID=A0A6C2UGI8_9BACT|nr:hypothetical protein [Pontiella sulfatireligans]VGO19248.1 hypothetical protein SCARR_01305 [Pontiella sulfatireligans]
MLSSSVADDACTSEVIDAWHYNGLTNGAELAEGISTGLVGGVFFNNDPLASIQNETVRWQADGADPSLFQGKDPSSYDGASNGLFQLSVDYLDGDFSGTAALTNGIGRVGFGLRGDPGGADIDATFRLVFNSGGGSNAHYRLEVTDDGGVNQLVGTFPEATLDHLNVRSVYDLDSRGAIGSFKVYYRLDGAAEVLAHAGQLASGFALDQLRAVVQTSNGGANWEVGDQVSTDNLVLRTLGGPPPPPTKTVLEEWTYASVTNGAGLSEGFSTTGTGLAWADSPLAVVSNQMQRWTYNGTTESAFQNKVTSGSSYENATSGVYQLSFDVVSAGFSGTAAADGKAQFGYGIRDNSLAGTDRNGMLLVRYEGGGATDEFRISLSAGSTIQQVVQNGRVMSNLHVRAVYDLDNAGAVGSFKAYYSFDGGTETEVVNQLAAGFTLETLRMQVQTINGGNSWAVGDVALLDNIQFCELLEGVETPSSLLADWLADYLGLGSQTNLTDNPDSDIAKNLLEYAFGGDPTNGLDVGHWPTAQAMENGGTNYIEYVYAKRTDAATRGLGYQLETNPDLIGGTWTNSCFVLIGSGELPGGAFDAVTNQVPMVGNTGFIRLKVEYTP